MKLTSKVSINATFHLVITEGEMKALDALAGYGTDEFLKTFYEKMGKHYLEPHEKDLRCLFAQIKEMSSHIAAMEKLKKEGLELSKKYSI